MAEIERALSQVKLKVCTPADAQRFLNNAELKKDNIDRLCAWLLVLKVVPEVTPKALAKLCQEYDQLKEKLLENQEKPLEGLPSRERSVIKADIARSTHWFKSIVEELGLPEKATSDGVLHAYRILATLSLNDKYYEYTQGYDRYLYVGYTLGLVLVQKTKLTHEFAEAMSFHLCLKMIKLASVADILDNMKKPQVLFDSLDLLVKKYVPQSAKLLAEMGHGSFHYAMKWRILFFADEHNLEDILLLWDMLFLRNPEVDEYWKYLALGHVRQVEPDSNSFMVERLQKYKDWDTIELVNFANKTYFVRKNRRGMMIVFAMLLLVVAVLVQLYTTSH